MATAPAPAPKPALPDPKGTLITFGFVAVVVLATSGLARLVRLAVDRLHHPEAQSCLAWSAVSGTLWSIFAHLSAAGLTVPSATAFLAALASLVHACAAFLREYRSVRGPAK